MTKSVDPDEMTHYEPSYLIYIASTISVLDYRAEKVDIYYE